DLRRQAIATLVANREMASRVAIVELNALEQLRTDINIHPSSPVRHPSELTVLVRNLEQLDAVLCQRPAMVYCEFEDVRRYKAAVPRAKAAGVPIGLATLRILKPGEEGFLNVILQAEPDAVLVRNLGAMLYF